MKKLLLLSLLISYYSIAQPTITWQKCLGGGTADESGQSIIQTNDGGYIFTGAAVTNNGDVSGNHGNGDVWVVKQSSIGVIEWQKCLGGTGQEFGTSIIQTIDGGYILTGTTTSNNGDVSGNHGNEDVWVAKLSSIGVIEWQKCLGGSNKDNSFSILQTSGGGYILIGNTGSNDGDVSGNHGSTVSNDVWVVKLSSIGVIEWQKCLGGYGKDFGQSIKKTIDGGYILTGSTNSINDDVSGLFHGGYDIWVVKLSSIGVIEWQKCLGGNGDENGQSITQTLDGGYILTGYTTSNNGDVSGVHGDVDSWVVKLSSIGVIEWQKCLGGSAAEYPRAIQQTTDGGYVLIGKTYSNNGDVNGNHGLDDVWVVKLSSLGSIQWQKCLGGSLWEQGISITQTLDGGYILTGWTGSNDGNVSGNHGGGFDAWVVKLSSTLGLEESSYNDLVSFYPNPVTNILNLHIENNSINQTYTISDVGGKVIIQGKINSDSSAINVEHLTKGVYFIELLNHKTYKFIKN
jgi:hypothetical protein